MLLTNVCFGQNTKLLQINSQSAKHTIERKQVHKYEVFLQRDIFYSISVEQLGIDVVLQLMDAKGKTIADKDSPTGKLGEEKITFSPDSSGKFMVCVQALDEAENSQAGTYSVQISTISKELKHFTISQLLRDFDILKNAYIETRVGLWYNTYSQFDSLCNSQRKKLKDQMTALDFYRITAPITAFTKEGHSSIAVSDATNDYFKQHGRYFPFFVKLIDKKLFVINDVSKLSTKGLMITKINGLSADSILKTFEMIEPADGFNVTSKHKWIESSFSKYYIRFFGSPATYQIEFVDPTNKKKTIENIPSLKYKEYVSFRNEFLEQNPNYSFTKPAELGIDSSLGLATLTINDFGAGNYNGKAGFKKFLDESFATIKTLDIKHLVIDLRKNEGGSQGMEDILLSYLIDQTYKKYKYAEIPSFDYSFLDYTDYKGQADVLRRELSKEFYQVTDGRYLQRPGQYEGLPPDSMHYSGKVYILISGLTFSGGSEFAALAKNHTNAIFIGEETGGGYYGNTSGRFLIFTLPETKTTGRLPLIKYVVETNVNKPSFGQGLVPDHPLQQSIQDYIDKRDVEKEFVKKIIAGN